MVETYFAPNRALRTIKGGADAVSKLRRTWYLLPQLTGDGRWLLGIVFLSPAGPVAAATASLMTEVKTRLPGRLPGFPIARPVGRQLGWLPIWPARPVRSGRTVPRWAVVCAGLSPVLLTVAWLAADVFQPASYSPIRQTISALAGQGGTDRWIMTGALFLVGGCYLFTAAGLTGVRLPARILLIIAGICSAGIAASPVTADGATALHLAWTALGAVTIAVWPAVAGWRAPQRPVIVSARGSAIVTMLFVVLLAWLVLETRGGSDLGLAERLTSSMQTSWPFVVALMLRRATPYTSGRSSRSPRPTTGRRPRP